MSISTTATTQRAERRSDWWREAWALFAKDVQAELRTKVAISAVGIFAFTSLLLLGLATAVLKEVSAFDRLGFFRTFDQTRNVERSLSAALYLAWDDTSKMGLLWVLLCFAAFTGLAHSFVHEEETGTVTALRLNMSPGAVFAGKLAFNLALIFGVALLVTPVYMAITGMKTGSASVFMGVMVSGCLGLASAATIVAALAAKARGTGALYGAIGLPLLVVFLILLLNAARALYDTHSTGFTLVRDVGGLWSYGVLMITVSVLTFPFVWED